MTTSRQGFFRQLGTDRAALLIITLMLAGRAMTLAFIADAGSGGLGEPPAAWLMPLVGDAVVGVSALGVACLIIWGRGLGAWTLIVVWNSIGIWDALSAFLLHQSVPWPEFFMIKVFGSSMFFIASIMHIVNLWLVTRSKPKAHYLATTATARATTRSGLPR